MAASVNLSLISVKNQIAHRSHNNAVRGHYDSRRSRAVKMVNGTVAQLKTDLTVKIKTCPSFEKRPPSLLSIEVGFLVIRGFQKSTDNALKINCPKVDSLNNI